MGNSTRLLSACLTLAGALLLLGLGCATGLPPRSWDFFAASAPADPWSRTISGWQARQRAADLEAVAPAPSPVAEGSAAVAVGAAPGDLRAKYAAFRSEHQRALAREVAAWIQRESREHYIEDGPVDHWATLQETLRANGDDCDGLELLVYQFLLDLGFHREEVYRAIVYRRSDGQHHMVTLWFEDRADPWVIDPTGAMTYGMPRLSELPGWAPLKVFSEERDFSVHEVAAVGSR
jgi:predicted transglutaminase-like cysteine proteinase